MPNTAEIILTCKEFKRNNNMITQYDDKLTILLLIVIINLEEDPKGTKTLKAISRNLVRGNTKVQHEFEAYVSMID